MGREIRLVRLAPPVMQALLAGDLASASREAGATLSPYLVEEGWLWRIRLPQVEQDPGTLDWIARAAIDLASGVVVGHVGFHGPPDEQGMVEVAYSVDPALRRRGWGRELLRAALVWAETEPAVRTVRASVSPENVASLTLVRGFGFVQVGEQWDEEDGLELVFELPLQRPTPGPAGGRAGSAGRAGGPATGPR